MQLSFSQQVTLVVLDKLVLGAVTVGVGFLASRLLQRYKARQSLFVEISKARIAKFSDLIDRFEKVRKRCDGFAYEMRLEAKERFLKTRTVTREEISEVFSYGGDIRLSSERRVSSCRQIYTQLFL